MSDVSVFEAETNSAKSLCRNCLELLTKDYRYYKLLFMPLLIAMTCYDIEEVCEELAKKTGRVEKLSRQRVHTLIKKNIPAAQRMGRRILITNGELEWLAEHLKTKHRKRLLKDDYR